jgi:hypothetical protein
VERSVTPDAGSVVIDLEALGGVDVALVGGEVTVAGTPGPSRIEVHCLSGPPVRVSMEGDTLVVRQERGGPADLLGVNWVGADRPRALVTVQCPPSVTVRTSSVCAPTVLAGLVGRIRTATVSAPVTLSYIGGDIKARTVSGSVEMDAVTGRLRIETVSGSVDLVAGRLSELDARSTSGRVNLDLEPVPGGSYRCTTVSGDVAVRIPPELDAEVDAWTLSGRVDLGGPRSAGRPDGAPSSDGSSLVLRSLSGRLALVTARAPDNPSAGADLEVAR